MKIMEMMHFITASDCIYLLAAGWAPLGIDIRSIVFDDPNFDGPFPKQIVDNDSFTVQQRPGERSAAAHAVLVTLS